MEIGKSVVQDVVLSHVRNIFPLIGNVDVNPSDHFVCLGGSSIDRTLLVDNVLESLLLNIPLLDLTGATQVSELVNMIYEN